MAVPQVRKRRVQYTILFHAGDSGLSTVQCVGFAVCRTTKALNDLFQRHIRLVFVQNNRILQRDRLSVLQGFPAADFHAERRVRPLQIADSPDRQSNRKHKRQQRQPVFFHNTHDFPP